jgi:hypothetical protein
MCVTRFAPRDEVFGSRGEKFGAYAEFACIVDGRNSMTDHDVDLERVGRDLGVLRTWEQVVIADEDAE